MAPLSDLALVAGATARLTRFITSDNLGDWLIVHPAKVAVVNALEDSPLEQEAAAAELNGHTANASSHPLVKAVSGLECPFCVGTWIGFGVLASYHIARRRPATLALWRFVAGGLSLNYAVGHVSARID